jgi:hypothetical protein
MVALGGTICLLEIGSKDLSQVLVLKLAERRSVRDHVSGTTLCIDSMTNRTNERPVVRLMPAKQVEINRASKTRCVTCCSLGINDKNPPSGINETCLAKYHRGSSGHWVPARDV